MTSPQASDALLINCIGVFKRYGYHGTTMDALASACGLTKAAFYHYYRSKQALAADALQWSRSMASKHLFAIAYDPNFPIEARAQKLAAAGRKWFLKEPSGCVMGLMLVDAMHGVPELLPIINGFFDDWAKALAHLLGATLPPARAARRARLLVADYEGAILLARLHNDASYVAAVDERAIAYIIGRDEKP
jgi:TetR/AcrR family transcriptional regulator, transcriptional repressor for nem operon